jgi:hypothetical protein
MSMSLPISRETAHEISQFGAALCWSWNPILHEFSKKMRRALVDAAYDAIEVRPENDQARPAARQDLPA